MSNPSAGSRLKSSITEASRKIESIIDDAERAAAAIRSDAQADAQREAQRALNERSAELAAVVQPLVERVEVLRSDAVELMKELETVTKRLLQMTQEDALLTLKPEPDPAEPDPASTHSLPEREVEVEQADEPTVLSEPAPSEPPPAPAAEPSEPGPSPVAYPGTSSNDSSSSSSTPEEAVLRATQMAVAGNSREKIEGALRDEFDLDDPSAVVDDILGPS